MLYLPSQSRLGLTRLAVLGLSLCLFVIMILIAIPGYKENRKRSRHELALEEMMMVVAAKEAYAEKNDLSAGATVTIDQLIEDGSIIKEKPVFPMGVTFEINTVGQRPTCMLDGQPVEPLAGWSAAQTASE